MREKRNILKVTHSNIRSIRVLSLRQLQAFIWTVRLKTLARAAQRLCVAQPTMSKRIQELEAECGFEVFKKSGRSVELTSQGHSLYALAEQILDLVEQVSHIGTADDTAQSPLWIGVTELTAQTWLPKLLNLVTESFPSLQPHVSIEQGVTLLNKLKAGELDLIVRPPFPAEPGLLDLPLTFLEMNLMGSERLCDPDQIYDGIALSRLPFLTHGRSTGALEVLTRWMRDIGADPQKVTEVDSLVAQVGLAVAGMGVTLLPPAVFRPLVDSGQLFALKTTIEVPAVEYRVGYRLHDQRSIIARVAQSIPDACDFTMTAGPAQPRQRRSRNQSATILKKLDMSSNPTT